MILHEITDVQAAELSDFTNLTDVELRKTREPKEGLYLAESEKIIERALRAGHQPRAVITTEQWLPKLSLLLAELPDTKVYVGQTDQLEQLTGFHMHRGALASMHRPLPLDPAMLLRNSNTVVVLEDLTDHTNVGAIFRSVAALGADAVLLTPGCADPLYRRSVRVSMGAVLQVPWARLPDWKQAGPLIRDSGFTLAAFALQQGAEDLSQFVTALPHKLALMFGSEGPGLSRRALASSTHVVTIPMEHDVDSLNVATAAALSLWAVRTGAEQGSRNGGEVPTR